MLIFLLFIIFLNIMLRHFPTQLYFFWEIFAFLCTFINHRHKTWSLKKPLQTDKSLVAFCARLNKMQVWKECWENLVLKADSSQENCISLLHTTLKMMLLCLISHLHTTLKMVPCLISHLHAMLKMMLLCLISHLHTTLKWCSMPYLTPSYNA